MSARGRNWALKVRGCTIAEHAVLLRLGSYHHEQTGRCFPNRDTLADELECSERYISEIFESVEEKRFLERQERFDPNLKDLLKKGRRTSNEFKLNIDRWFPFYSDEVEREEKQLLAYFRHAVESPEIAQGILSAWIEKPCLPKSKTDLKNAFRKHGRSLRSRRSRPTGEVLWIAYAHSSHKNHIEKQLREIMAQIRKDTGCDYRYRSLHTWLTTASL